MKKNRDYPLAPTPNPSPMGGGKIKGSDVKKNDKGQIVETSFVSKQRPSGASVRKEVTTTHSIDKDDPSMYNSAYDKYTKSVTKTSKSGDIRTRVIEKEGNTKKVTRSK